MTENNRSSRHGGGKYADPSPYPEIKVLQPNLQYAELLIDDYAGVVSEFTAISQYLFHHYYFQEIDRELSDLVEGISIVEMSHMEMLAETIIKLGGRPVIRGSASTQCNYWNGSYVYYGSQLCEQLKADIDAEFQAIEAYRRHISLISDGNVQAILQRIILDEIAHIRHFNRALLKFCGCTYGAIL